MQEVKSTYHTAKPRAGKLRSPTKYLVGHDTGWILLEYFLNKSGQSRTDLKELRYAICCHYNNYIDLAWAKGEAPIYAS